MLLGNARLNRILLQEEQLQPAAPMRSLVYLLLHPPGPAHGEMPDKSHIRLAICPVRPTRGYCYGILTTAAKHQQCKSQMLAGWCGRMVQHEEDVPCGQVLEIHCLRNYCLSRRASLHLLAATREGRTERRRCCWFER